MAFANNAEFEDDFRKVGPDATAGFAPGGAPSDPTEHASSENLDVAAKADVADDDLEDDDDEVDEDDEDDDLDDEDLEDDDDEEEEAVADDEEDDDLEDEDDEDEDDEDEDDEELEDDPDAVKARLKDAETTARTR